MNQQVISSQDIVKAPTTLDKIPEDVQLAIIRSIQAWKRSEGTEQEREKGKRARDSALRSVALSCRNLLSVYQRELLSDVTLNFRSLFRFYLLLARNRDARKSVRSITFVRREDDLTLESLGGNEKGLQEDLGFVFAALTTQEIRNDAGRIALEGIVEGVYRFLSNIQTLVIRQPAFNIPLQSIPVNGTLAPLPFLTHSLKKLFIPMWDDVEVILKARNVVWILVFCTGLRCASLGCFFERDDFNYLAEFSETFSELSQVQKLALGVDFSSSERLQRYWDTAIGEQWIGGNRKSQAMFHLLKVTKNLQCLEINNMPSIAPEEKSFINSSFLPALGTLYLSLESLRLLGVDYVDPEQFKVNTNFSHFQRLKVISVDAMMVRLLHPKRLDFELPPGLKLLCIPYYYPDLVIQEDTELARAFKDRSFPGLGTVIVPSKPIRKNGTLADSEEFKKRWLEGRKELEQAEVFQSGKVKLRFSELGDSIGESSETDFMSSLDWLSPP